MYIRNDANLWIGGVDLIITVNLKDFLPIQVKSSINYKASILENHSMENLKFMNKTLTTHK